MKNKKLFAILTLVCFMFTLMPVAAFAAAADAQVEIQEDGVWVEEGVVKADTAFNVRVVDGTTGAAYVYYAVDEDGEGVAIADTASLKIKAEGEYKVNAIEVPAANATEVGKVLASLDTVAEKVATLVAWADSEDLIVGGYAEVSVDAEKQSYTLTATGANLSGDVLTIKANNGFNKDGIVVVKLVDKDGKAVKNAELTVSKAGYVEVTSETLTTDRKGEVELTITSGYANDGNKVIVKYEKAKVELTVNAYTNAATDVAVNAEPKAPVNIKSTMYNTGVQFKFVDANGIACPPAAYNIEVVDQPANAKLEGKDFKLATTDAKGKALAKGVYALKANKTLVKEGTYTVKVSLENGSTATAKFTANEMGDVVAIMFNPQDTPKTVAYGATIDLSGLVLNRDAYGVTESSSATLSVSGLAVDTFDGANLVVKNDDDFIGATITVLAKDGDFVATTELTVVDKAATIAYADTTAEVGVSKTLVGTVVDASNSASTVDLTGATVSAIVIDKASETAIAVANAQPNNGKINLTFLANEAGVYKVQTIVEFANKSYISAITEITVGGGLNTFKDVVVVSLGADKMIVNNDVVALDVAPFIENNRTMMQFNVLYVFGIDVEWVAETQSIVAEGNGLKVVMQLGSKVATVNGAEVALDVAPYSVNGRTVVPVGFITGLLDITPVFTYNADGTIADILFAK